MITIDIKPSLGPIIEKLGGYCPCSIERSEDTLCPCKAFREQQEPGPCHCGRYEKREE